MHYFKCLLLAFCFSSAHAAPHAASPTSAPDPANVKVPDRWADYAQNRKLEELLYQAVKAKHTRLLSKSYLDLVDNDLESLKSLRALVLSGDEERIRNMDWKINSCHYAGATIRALIINTYEQSMANDGRLTGPLQKVSADTFAEHMGRCERVFKRIQVKRLIGTMW